MEIRKTTQNDIEEIFKIYESARQFMAENGNPNQWSNIHPEEKIILMDIDKGKFLSAIREYNKFNLYLLDFKIRNRILNFLLFLVFILTPGCSSTKSSMPISLEIKPFEKIMEDKYKKLRVAREMILETEISSQVIVSRGNPDYFVEYLNADLKILPLSDSRQEVSDLDITPEAKISGNSLAFRLDSPSPGPHVFKLKAKAVLRREFVQVKEKIPFPLHDIPIEHIKYTSPSSLIDSEDEEIGKLASSIAQGEDDLYRVVFKVSEWVAENVSSQIDSSTIYTSQTASWVLENRKGVCDEKTNLLIGLLRSLKIPAKFVIGLVGVNYNGKINFKPHGWAEVYFPSAGWIPFDVAYNQLGFIDASHMKLSESVDVSEPITSYEWKSIDIRDPLKSNEGKSDNALLSIKDLEINARIKQITGTIQPLLELEPGVWYSKIETGSYNVIEATIINPHDFYVITDIYLQVPENLEIMEQNSKMFLMEPKTEKTVYWIVKPEVDRNENITTLFPVDVVIPGGGSSSVEFSVAKAPGYAMHSLKKIENDIEKKSKGEKIRR